MTAMDAAELHKTIGQRIAALRIHRVLTTAEFAALMGISLNLLGRIESGKNEVSAATIVKAAEVLGVTSAVLTGEEAFTIFEKKKAAAK